MLRPFQPPPTRWAAGHRGVDLAAEVGDPVRAALAGRVAFAGRVAGRGVVTVVHGGGLRTTYLPVKTAVPVGRAVTAGQVIGRLTDEGRHCRSPCLHWGLLHGEDYLDPLALLRTVRVRLYPPG